MKTARISVTNILAVAELKEKQHIEKLCRLIKLA